MRYYPIFPKVLCSILTFFIILLYQQNSMCDEATIEQHIVASLPCGILDPLIKTYKSFLDKTDQYIGHTDEAIAYLSDKNNYKLEIYDNGETYLLKYSIAQIKYPDLKYGEIEFLINKADYKIIETRIYK